MYFLLFFLRYPFHDTDPTRSGCTTLRKIIDFFICCGFLSKYAIISYQRCNYRKYNLNDKIFVFSVIAITANTNIVKKIVKIKQIRNMPHSRKKRNVLNPDLIILRWISCCCPSPGWRRGCRGAWAAAAAASSAGFEHASPPPRQQSPQPQ